MKPKSQTTLFKIKDHITIGSEVWIVRQYHKVFGEYKIVLSNRDTCREISIPLSKLQSFVNV